LKKFFKIDYLIKNLSHRHHRRRQGSEVAEMPGFPSPIPAFEDELHGDVDFNARPRKQKR
jgi:hypothetical protein